MKSKYLLFIVLILCLLFSACSKKSPSDPGDPPVFNPGIVDTQLDPGLKNVLNFNQLTVLNPDGAIEVNSQGEFKADFSLGAAESLETAVVPVVQDGIPVLLSYYFNEKDFNPFDKTTAIGTQTTALALIMMNPLWMNADQQIKKEVAQKAVKHAQFNTLASQIEQALRSQPTVYLGAGGADLTLYTTAAQISLDIYKDYVSDGLQKGSGANEVADRPDPYYEDGSGQKVYLYNPFYIYYGVGFFDYANNSLKKNHLMSPRPLKWGLIPYVGNYGKSEQTLADGNYSVVFYKGFKGTDGHTFDFSHPAGVATGINVCTGALNIVSVIWDFSWDFGPILDKIQMLLSGSKLLFDGISSQGDFADLDVGGQIGVLIVFIGSNADEIIKLHVSEIVQGGNAKATTVNYFKSLLPALKNISLPLKILGAATKVPFFVDIFSAPSRVQYDVSSKAGVLQPITTPANTPPTASFTVTPPSGTTSTDFQADASGSSDAQDPTSALQVRWDWDNNGWDTDYSTTKTANHRYTTTGTKTIKLGVKDSGMLEGSITKDIVVTTASVNTPPVASFTVNPPSGITQTDFQFDASGCTDAQDPVSSLQVRWDWDNDGWDTDYTTDKIATHKYSTAGTYTVVLRVRDTGLLENTVTQTVIVSSTGVGSIPIDGLIAYYPFNGNTNDESSHGNHGTPYNVVPSNDRFNNPKSAYEFGENRHVEISNESNFNLDKFTLSLWVKLNDTPTGDDFQHFISKSDLKYHGYVLQWCKNINKFSFWVGCGDGCDNHLYSDEVTKNQWYHLAGTYDGVIKKFYVNGLLIDSSETTFFNSSALLEIGQMANVGNFVEGLIDDIAIYNRALSEQEIDGLYHDKNW